jgi:hypothetical protein
LQGRNCRGVVNRGTRDCAANSRSLHRQAAQ